MDWVYIEGDIVGHHRKSFGEIYYSLTVDVMEFFTCQKAIYIVTIMKFGFMFLLSIGVERKDNLHFCNIRLSQFPFAASYFISLDILLFIKA